MKVITAAANGICMEHDGQMLIGPLGFERNFGVIGTYIDRRGNLQQVVARSVYGEHMQKAMEEYLATRSG